MSRVLLVILANLRISYLFRTLTLASTLSFLPVIRATRLLEEDVDSDMAWCFVQCYWNRGIVVFGDLQLW